MKADMNVAGLENLAVYLPLLALVMVAAVTDVRARRIPNWLTLSVILAGLAQSFTAWRVTTPAQSLGGLLLGFGVTFLLYILGGRGAGDVKLTAGIGAWVGPVGMIIVLAAAALVNLVVVLARSIANGRLVELLGSAGAMLLALASARRLGTQRVVDIGRAGSASIDRPLPNAVSMCVATMGVVVWVSRVGAG